MPASKYRVDVKYVPKDRGGVHLSEAQDVPGVRALVGDLAENGTINPPNDGVPHVHFYVDHAKATEAIRRLEAAGYEVD